jgi:hypothetical protein
VRDLLVAAVVGAPFLVGAVVGAAEAVDDAPASEVLRFEDDAIIESSGIVVDGRHVVTVNDSGDSARVFTVDLGSGETVGVTTWDGEADDLEALAPAGPGHVWAADIGDNGRSRASVTVTRVPVGRGDDSVDGESYRLTLPGGAADAETLLAHPVTGRLYVVTKGALGGQVLAAPERLREGSDNRLEPVGIAPGLLTDGAFFPDGHHIIVRNYDTAWVYTFPGLLQVGAFALPEQRQGEGIAIGPDGDVYVSSEGRHEALLRMAVPAHLQAAMVAPPVVPPAVPPVVAPTVAPGVLPSDTAAGPADGSGDRASSAADSAETWPWIGGGLLGVLALVLLFRSLRPR